jgi:glycosyltransferase involved in cell wall biosynthesis
MIVLSDALRENFAFMGPEYGARIRVVPNPSPIEAGSPRAAPEGELRLLYLSNLLVEKGYLDCIDAVVHIRRSLLGRSVKLTLAGAPLLGGDEYLDLADLERTLRKHVRYLDLENSIEIAGVVMGRKKLELLASAHIALLPTYYRNEGQPITLIEAMASGLPFVATAWRGIADLADRDVGILVPPRSPLAIADAVTELASNPELYARLSRNAVAVAGQFTRDLHIHRMMTVFREVCEPRRRSGVENS